MSTVRILALTSFLSASAVLAQSPPPISTPTPSAKEKPATKSTQKSTLESALEMALRNNPDLKVATVKLAEAEAELARTRLQVARKVVMTQHSIEEARALFQVASAHRDRLHALHARKAISGEELGAAEASMVSAREKLAVAEAELDYLLGKSVPRTMFDPFSSLDDRRKDRLGALGLGIRQADPTNVRLWATQSDQTIKGVAADKLRKALQKQVTVTMEEKPLSQLLEVIRKVAPEIHIHMVVAPQKLNDASITVNLKEVTIAAALQLLEDTLPDCHVIVREYGLLIAPEARIPPGALRLAKFLEPTREAPATTPGKDPLSR